MPQTQVIFYQEAGRSRIRDWLAGQPLAVQSKCRAKVMQLRRFGHELRRPHADSLRGGIHELRIKVGRVNFRLLYFFHGQNVAILAHGIIKEAIVPNKEIEEALLRKTRFESDPLAHTLESESWQNE